MPSREVAIGVTRKGSWREEQTAKLRRISTSRAAPVDEQSEKAEWRTLCGIRSELMDDGDVKTDWRLVMAGAGIYMGPRWKRRPGRSAGAAGFALADWIETERSNIRLFSFPFSPPSPVHLV